MAQHSSVWALRGRQIDRSIRALNAILRSHTRPEPDLGHETVRRIAASPERPFVYGAAFF
jgi:hypothetical protein